MAVQDVVTFQGTLQAGPPKSSAGAFPTSIVNAAFTLKPSVKPAPVNVSQKRNLSSPSSYTSLDVGSSEAVTKANFLYVRTEAPFLFRITTDDGVGGSVVSVMPIDGIFAMEAPPDKFIKLLEAQGTGVVEYFASGNQ